MNWGALVALFAEEDPVVRQNTDGIAAEMTPAGDEGGPVERLELLELTAVEDACENLSSLEWLTDVGTRNSQQVLRVIDGIDGCPRRGARATPPQMADDVATDPDRIGFVEREVVGEPGCPGVHGGTAEALLIGVLVDRHLHQGRATEIDPRRVLDQHGVVAHARHVGAAGGARPEHEGDRGNTFRRQSSQVAETSSTGHEDLRLLGQIGST